MSTLFVDIGNTRLKWAVDGGPMQAVAHDGAPDACLWDIVERDAPASIVAVDVTGTLVEPGFAGVPLRCLRSSAQACGIRNAYPDPAGFGPDRWAALIGARALEPGALCVIDAGSALTFDLLDADGAHLGGWIAPGLGMSVAALLTNTRGIRAGQGREGAWREPARDTGSAVEGGAMLAALGFVERALRAATERLGAAPAVFLTGGDAAALAAELDGAALVDDLVLQGLAHWDRADA